MPEKDTAVIVEVGRRGMVSACERHVCGNRIVKANVFNLLGIQSGTVKIFP